MSLRRGKSSSVLDYLIKFLTSVVSLFLAVRRMWLMSTILGLIAASLIADFWIYFGVSVDSDASSAVFDLKPRLALVDFLAGPLR